METVFADDLKEELKQTMVIGKLFVKILYEAHPSFSPVFHQNQPFDLSLSFPE